MAASFVIKAQLKNVIIRIAQRFKLTSATFQKYLLYK